MSKQRTTLVYRQVSFSLRCFERLKDWQRHLEQLEGRRMTNSEILGRMVLSLPRPR